MFQVFERGPTPGCTFVYDVLAGQKFDRGRLVAVTAALKAVNVGHANAVAIGGVSVDHHGEKIEARRGVFRLACAAATGAHINAPVYALNGTEVSLESTGGRLKVGTIEGIDADGVWVRV